MAPAVRKRIAVGASKGLALGVALSYLRSHGVQLPDAAMMTDGEAMSAVAALLADSAERLVAEHEVARQSVKAALRRAHMAQAA